MANVVCAELKSVPVLRQARRVCHDACVEHEDIKAAGHLYERFGSRFDRGKEREVEFHGLNRCIWDLYADLSDGVLGFLHVTSSEPDLRRIVLVLTENRVFSGAVVPPCDQNDFALQGGNGSD